eukprot:CAMPEP_0198686302 /NCGR_PEP_ID=MMETSP1468-20131203/14751_1 /TAXON_ID=1461545 /ORGANISM="Mantoniella sp, Strain CCMP1436" /LENGTH=105 /DNA_ID=CAMNT_0044432343 /DNA_START=391 /DNA_END=705 /DNA_ORIENTATION=+
MYHGVRHYAGVTRAGPHDRLANVLFDAAAAGQVSVVERLLSDRGGGGAHPNEGVARNGSVVGLDMVMKKYPLGVAAMNGHAEVVQLLLAHADVDPNVGATHGRYA